MLDAVTGGDAARLYERLGWVRVGDIPGYALMPRGGLCSTTVYYRNLGGYVQLTRSRGLAALGRSVPPCKKGETVVN